MGDAAPREIGDVKKAVHTAEVDEDPKVDDVLDCPLQHLPHLKLLQNLLALLLELMLDELAVGDDDVFVLRVQLNDLEFHPRLQVRLKVAHWADIDLRTGEERLHPVEELYDHTPLDAADDRAFDDLFVLVDFFDPLPAAHLVGLLLREHKLPIAVLLSLQVHLHGVPGADLVLPELVAGNDPVALVANVDDHVVLVDLEDATLDDVLLADVDGGLVDDLAKLVVDGIVGVGLPLGFKLVERYGLAVRLARKALCFFGALQLFGGNALGGLVELGHVDGGLLARWDVEVFRGFFDGLLKDPIYEARLFRRLRRCLSVAFTRGLVGRCGARAVVSFRGGLLRSGGVRSRSLFRGSAGGSSVGRLLRGARFRRRFFGRPLRGV